MRAFRGGPKLHIPLKSCKGYHIDGIDYILESHGNTWDLFMSRKNNTPLIGTIVANKINGSRFFSGSLKDSKKKFDDYKNIYDIIRAMVCNKFYELSSSN